jgi:hypothetical protein
MIREEFFKTLMPLFAISSKLNETLALKSREYFKAFLNSQLNVEGVTEFFDLFNNFEFLSYIEKEGEARENSTGVFEFCKTINNTFTHAQKTVVFVYLIEMIIRCKCKDSCLKIHKNVAEVFNLSKKELLNIDTFIEKDQPEELDFSDILIVSEQLDANK